MSRRLHISILAVAIALASTAIGQTHDSASEKPFGVVGNVGGEVKLFLASSGAPVKDASKVVVWLTPRGVVAADAASAAKIPNGATQQDV